MRRIVELIVGGLFTIYSSVAWASSGEGPDFLVFMCLFPMLLVLLPLLKRRFFSVTVITGVGFYLVLFFMVSNEGGAPFYIKPDRQFSEGLLVTLVVPLLAQLVSAILLLFGDRKLDK